ncbi:hypothetical protein ACFVR1_07060 [Psychrobacillus sp. NPDC058041]|uniref:hypothetical protein n=1 Tax=Psychrobacillus sp. NPDC058041 TaxID=3346310 RepID=UPI0036D91F17
MKLFSSVKGKVIVGALSVSLLAGGTGAAAAANNQWFGDFLRDVTQPVITKMAGWAGLEVQATSNTQQGNIAGEVNRQLTEADGQIYEFINNTAVPRGNREIQEGYNNLSWRIGEAKNEFINKAVTDINNTVDHEVDMAKKNLETAANHAAQAYVNDANNRWYKNPGYTASTANQ